MERIKINDMVIGNTYEAPLVVSSAVAKMTRNGNEYLLMTLFDGDTSITCNYWDWSGESKPDTSKVYTFKVNCTEYMGKKQLTCKSVKANTDFTINDFMPHGSMEPSDCYKEIYCLASNLQDDFYRELCLHIFEEAKDYWLNIPGAKSIHHDYVGGTLAHSLSVATLCKATAEHIDGAWVDLAVTGGMLHDVGKLFTYQMTGVAIDYTEDGILLDHIFMGAELVGNMATQFIMDEMDELKLQLLRHIILSHHMKYEHGSPVTPRCIEAWIVSHCDALDATCEAIRKECKKVGNQRFTDKIWAAGNVPHFTTQAMEALCKKQHMVGLFDLAV